VISAALIFYILTIIGIFLLRRNSQTWNTLSAFGYPIVPALYVVGADGDSTGVSFIRRPPPGPA